MSNPKKGIAITVILLLAFAGCILGLFIYQNMPKKKQIDPNQFHGTLLEKPREIKSFSLTGIDNKAFTNANLHGQWTLIFFGFTHCGYLCPTTMAELAKMYRQLEADQVKPLPRIILISIDPQRDQLDKLGQYVKAFHPNFYGAKGDEDTIKKMTREMGIAYIKIALPQAKTENDYDMQHSGAVMLFNPQGELNAFFTSPQQADLMVKDYRLLIG